MDIHANPALLAKALGKASKRITAVSYEYPAYWHITTKADTYCLGDVNGFISWHTEDGTKAESLPNTDSETPAPVIALSFAYWLETVEGN